MRSIVLAALIFFSHQALATCSISGAGEFKLGKDIALSSNVPVGTVLSSHRQVITYGGCRADGVAYLEVPQKLQVGSGLSVVFYYDEKPINGTTARLGFFNSRTANHYFVSFDLVRSAGPVAAGDLHAGGIRAKQLDSDGVSLGPDQPGAVIGSAILGTCVVTTPNILVPLPAVTSSELSSIGATFGEVFFTMAVSCNSSSKVYAEFTDSNNVSNSGESLELGAGSTAKGIRFQMLLDGSLVRYKQRRGLGDIQSDGLIPMSVRYIRDGNLIPGRAVAQSTYIISYD
ncbi:fimbrial protein [Pseudomonas synxantha]|uniref:fimbrial protein n=1 Tax=Pseudomonas TaxID=286 RepID=UPI000F721410|nr:hypothetical protein C4J92_2124 [Pseudomonas sp. R3-18-08]AZF26254.1 hypothetical protein C4J90_2081 [Pseudomonas sp. R2-60-08W]AZF31619.1 hypothetical protein C4J89_2144 [Pseudomonas sp. R4-35-07]AZF36894.1 hypothetical protein C4J88_2111 [Pseudomonas sp. R4-39-08]AZF52561.1 hypothetical protein C4J85_2076 [Pseudomonas sp. R4-34-07]MDQ0980393.1 type 1 fimbria pilin [Pseudomonas synxantha]